MSLKPICVKCHMFYKPKKNGFYFLEGKPIHKPDGSKVEPGQQEPWYWIPYKLWSGDIYECAGCNSQIIYGIGMNPITQDYKENFREDVKALSTWDPPYQVNDC